MRCVAITGGAGFVGRRLAAALLDDAGLDAGLHVRLLDVREPEPIPFAPSTRAARDKHRIGDGRLSFIKCDLTDQEQVDQALEGVDTLFHLASYGMSGSEMLNVPLIRAVNIGGTANLLSAARRLGTARVIYVSTYNCVFGTQAIVNGSEETTPYYPHHLFHDEYSRTKRQAEEMVLRENSPTLCTCAIRPAAIYGDGEERHLPRILRTVRAGLGVAAIGSKDVLCDWVYVDNLSHSLILAASSLATSGPASRAAGQAYCISDGAPINNFEFLRPLCEGLGYRHVFLFYVPTWLMFHLAWALELLRLLLLWLTLQLTCLGLPRLASLLRLCCFQPFLTRAEVLKVGVTHYFSQARAAAHLGYAPLVAPRTAMARCVEYYAEEFGTERVKREAREQRARERKRVASLPDSRSRVQDLDSDGKPSSR